MATFNDEREEFITAIRNRFDKLQEVMKDLQRAGTRDNDMETLHRIERARKSTAEKGEAVQMLLDEAREVEDEEDWPDARQRLEAAWQEYSEAVDRARLEMERAEELS
ncbi:MAG TPA: hypothetical protein VJ925_11210 [Longimicrobiales bacterium]|nr:hypothetical protein [Longimicrobiales bacterium]